MSAAEKAYVRTDEAPKLPAPLGTAGVYAALRDRFFPTPGSAVATVILGSVIAWIVWSILDWAVVTAVWTGEDREACIVANAGACWPFVKAKFLQWVYGFYPIDQRWRVNAVFFFGALSLAGLLIPSIRWKSANAVFFFLIYPIATILILIGGRFGLEHVETDKWGGLLVTLILSVTGIVASMPIGILLALGRRSEMPVVKMLCVGFIEAVRGVPLVTVLFMASVMFPLFMPPGVNFDKLLRVVIGVALFSAAYMAENVRAGLQAIPKGQMEAAQSLGLSYWKAMSLVVMPQALKVVIPSIVNSFISLFKDTSLVLIVGLFDLLNMVQAGFNDPKWVSPQTGNTGYFSLALIYWAFCFAMSRYSQFVERRLNTGHKR
jgi:general L-amino acid transport system permease protein